MILTLTIISGLAFIIYGLLCLLTNHMVVEFERYRMTRFRVLTGYLEVLGGLGSIIGYFLNDMIFIFSCSGLAILMTMGAAVRIKVGDSLIQTLPAIILGIINYYLVYLKIQSGIFAL